MTESECSLFSPEYYCIIEKGAGRDGRVGASVGSTGQVGAARGSGWLVEDVGPLIGLSYLAQDGCLATGGTCTLVVNLVTPRPFI